MKFFVSLVFMFCLILTFIISQFKENYRSPASNSIVNYDEFNGDQFIKDYEKLKQKVEQNERDQNKPTFFDRFWASFNDRVPHQGKEMSEYLKGRSPEDLQGHQKTEFSRLQKEFYMNLVENNLKFLEKEAKKDPAIKKAAESLEKSVSPEVEKEVGGFKFKTKADLLRMHSSLNLDSKWFKSEARVNLSGGERFELFFYKNFHLFFPIQTEFCYQLEAQNIETKINTSLSENLSFNVSQNFGQEDTNSSYVLQFNTSF